MTLPVAMLVIALAGGADSVRLDQAGDPLPSAAVVRFICFGEIPRHRVDAGP